MKMLVPDINFAIKAPETAKCGINGVWTVGRANDYDIRTLFESIHKSEQLGYNPTFDFAMRLKIL